MSTDNENKPGITRRTALKGMGAAATVFSIPAIANAQAAGTIKLGYVSPSTGPLGLFGDADGFTLKVIRKLLGDGLKNNGKTYNVEIIARDSQSNPNKAGELAGELP